ncbi:BnaC05g18930D [Brassica napus]|uniref:BnaC05g18930D protein n=1 Tax=Brassica napus TaxID=3708 RepID=A0A078IBZ3_BRANA|nr:BnaC05g18930D [Brassica napus]
MNEKLSVMELLKRAAKLLFSNINLAFFLFFSSLPLFSLSPNHHLPHLPVPLPRTRSWRLLLSPRS